MRILFCTDLHGSERCYRKFLNAAKAYHVDALILGGDLTGKVIVPLTRAPGMQSVVRGDSGALVGIDDLSRLEKELADQGAYLYLIEPSREEMRCRDELLRELLGARLESWLELAEERLGGSQISMYVTGGQRRSSLDRGSHKGPRRQACGVLGESDRPVGLRTRNDQFRVRQQDALETPKGS